jgi:hypothetical protein
MKLPIVLVVLGLVNGCLADDPVKLNASEYGMDYKAIEAHSDFVETMKDHKVSLSSVIENAEQQMSSPEPWEWAEVDEALQFEDEDMSTEEWVPQGITSTADAYEDGKWEDKQAWMVSWHNGDDSMVRVSFVDQDTKKYQHALLVVPTTADDFTDFNSSKLHAGGIVWYEDALWVADTWNGVRVFDLSNIIEVSLGEGVGKQGDDKWTASNHKYIIPQKSLFQNTTEFRHSFVTLDRTVTPNTMLIGEYQSQSDLDAGATSRIVQWEIQDQKPSSLATFAYNSGLPRIQGAVSANGQIYFSSSNSNDPSNLYTWTPGQSPEKQEHFFPPHSEDLSYDKPQNLLYGLTEGEDLRYILAYRV